MKKQILILTLFILILLTGCSLGNTPTARVEDMLLKYQMLDNSINISHTNLTTDKNLTTNQINRYKEIIKKQYKNLVYEIKDEEIDGENATVTIQIEVTNYKDIINNNNLNNHEKTLTDLEEAKEKTTYTLELTLIKDDNDNWQVEPLTKENYNKLLGIY